MKQSARRLMQCTALCSTLMLLCACQGLEPRDETLNHIDAALKESPAAPKSPSSGVPAAVSNALLPTIRLNQSKVPQMSDEQRFDISVNNVPARQFFMSLVQGTKYNMVIHPEVKGTISLHLKNVTIPEVMEAVRDVYGYEFQRTPYGFQVLPSRLEARIYQINYLNVDRSGSSSTFVSSGTLTEGPSAAPVGPGAERAATGATGGLTGRRQPTVVGTEISTYQPQTSFWKELRTSIRAIIGNGEGRSVVVNPLSGVVVVRAIPSELREVETFLKTTQLIVERQVILEAKIVEVDLNKGYQAGINWAAVLGDLTIGQTGGGTLLTKQAGVSDIAGQTGNLDPRNFSPIQGNLASAFGGMFSLAVDSTDFKAFLELLKTQGNVQVLSSPRIATLNNQKALIKVGSDQFFVTDVSTTTITGTTTTSTPNVTLTPFFSGIALDVTPQISQDGEVTLHIHPSVSDVVDQQKTITIGGISQQLPLALSTVRESDSIVRARSGQIVVIGGLMQDRTDKTNAKSPLLGDLPLVGSLFTQKKNSAQKSELVILLRPIVVGGDQQWSEARRSAADSMKKMRETLQEWRSEGKLEQRLAPAAQ